jgi:hypothetical protein
MVVTQLPHPKALPVDKIEQLMCHKNRRFDTLVPETQQLKEGEYIA